MDLCVSHTAEGHGYNLHKPPQDCPRDQSHRFGHFSKNSSYNLKHSISIVFTGLRKNMFKTLHISHGRGVVAALRRNQFDPQIARSARNSLTFPASYLWVKLEV